MQSEAKECHCGGDGDALLHKLPQVVIGPVKKTTLLNCLSHVEKEDLLRGVASDQHPSQECSIAKGKISLWTDKPCSEGGVVHRDRAHADNYQLVRAAYMRCTELSVHY